MNETAFYDGLELGPMAGDEIDQVLALINVVQPNVPWSREYFDWQYFGNPAGAAKLYVARDGGHVVSLYSAVLQRMQVSDRLMHGWMVQDVMTHPTHRGRGLLHRLAELCLASLRASHSIGYSFPNNQSERSFLRSGWHQWGSVPWWSRDLASEEAASVDPQESATFDVVVTHVWNASGLRFGVRRDMAHLNWRYCKPGQRYTRFVLDDRGVLVVKLYDAAEERRGHICDVFVRASEEETVSELIRFAAKWAAQRGATTLTAWMPHEHRYARHFEAAGLSYRPSASRLVVITAPADVEPFIKNPANWYLTQADSDVY